MAKTPLRCRRANGSQMALGLLERVGAETRSCLNFQRNELRGGQLDTPRSACTLGLVLRDRDAQVWMSLMSSMSVRSSMGEGSKP